MIEDVIARLVLGEGEDDWAKLGLIEQTLRNVWDDVSIMVGEQGNPLRVSVADLQQAGAVAARDIREFLVRGYVTETRSRGALQSEREPWRGRAVLWVFYPAEPEIPQFERISQALKAVWPEATIEYGSARRGGLPPDQVTDDHLMEFLVVD